MNLKILKRFWTMPFDLQTINFHPETLLEKKSSFWKSNAGLKRRTELLGKDATFRLVNNALQAYGERNEIDGWEGVEGVSNHCEYCLSHVIGHFFRFGQFMPSIPAHHGCTCTWRLIKRRIESIKRYVMQKPL